MSTEHRLKLTLAAAASLLALAACKDEAGRRVDLPDPTPAAFVAGGAGLPFADPAPVGTYAPDVGYAYAERAYGLQRTFYEEEPNYAFYDDGREPWAWETADDWSMYAEPWDDGYRYYYYEPGAAYPYFVQDADYGYGFDAAGVLIALLDSRGDFIPRERWYDAAPLAGRYYARGKDLRNAAYQSRHIPVAREVWTAQAPQVARASDRWIAAAREDRGWKQWRDRGGAHEALRFDAERARRAAKGRGDRRVAVAAPPQAFAPEAHVGRGSERKAFARDMAAAADRHGRQASAIEPPRQTREARQPPGQARHEERGQGRPDRVREAHAERPAPQPQAFNPDRGAGEGRGHGGNPHGDHGPGQPQGGPQPQAAPGQGGGDGKGGGHDKGHGGGHGKKG